VNLRTLLPFTRRDAVSGLENPNIDIVAALIASQDGAASSGVAMTPAKALRLAAVYACVRVIAESVASLPIEISRLDAAGEGRELVRNDPRWLVLNEFPNPEMTGVELIENWVAHALLWGTGYLFAVYNGAGQVAELWPLKPDVTQPRRTPQGRLYYETELGNGEKTNVPAERVIPLKALMATSPVMNAREMLANAAAAQEYAGRFWQNNARPGGIIQLPDSMDEDEMDDFVRRWKSGHEGLKRAQLVGILTAGAKWQEVGISPQQAQFIETRQFGTREIARMYGVPLHRVGDAVQSGGGGSGMGNSLEQQSIEFITYTLRSWIVRAEQAFRTKLFASKSDLATETFARFNFTELMRGDIKSRYEAYAIGIQWGILNRAEPRRLEGLPAPPDDQLLEEFLVPLNMIPSSKIDEIDVGGSNAKAGGGGDKNKDGGGTQPTTGSDGSTPQANSLALLSTIVRDKPELARAIADFAIERAQQQPLELPAGDPES
jgi:HK97 family phage portal protein